MKNKILILKSWVIFLPLTLALITTILILNLSRVLPQKLPLFYSLPWGNKQLVDKQQLLIIPAIMVGITFINLIISWQLHPSQTFFKKTLIYSSIVISIICLVTFLKIIFIFI